MSTAPLRYAWAPESHADCCVHLKDMSRIEEHIIRVSRLLLVTDQLMCSLIRLITQWLIGLYSKHRGNEQEC